MAETRSHGVYWIRQKHRTDWQIAEYEGGFGWALPGTDIMFDEDDDDDMFRLEIAEARGPIPPPEG